MEISDISPARIWHRFLGQIQVGGAIYATGAGTTVNIYNSTLQRNTATVRFSCDYSWKYLTSPPPGHGNSFSWNILGRRCHFCWLIDGQRIQQHTPKQRSNGKNFLENIHGKF
jgi:hypothetical protein